MTQYRTQVQIVADVLRTAKEMNTEGNGVGITTLLRRGNMSYSRLNALLSRLLLSGLLLELNRDKVTKYQISEKGLRFLAEYHTFENFAQSFGLLL